MLPLVPPPFDRQPAPPVPEVLLLGDLPPRIQRMVHLLVEHQEAICLYAIGCVELHYHEERVKPKLHLNP